MTYYVRSAKGDIKAKLSNTAASTIMQNAKGHFREAHYPGPGRVTVYEIDGDFTYGTSEFKIMLWVGDTLVPVDKP